MCSIYPEAPSLFLNSYELTGKSIGRGTFGLVKEVKSKEDGQIYAAKVFSLSDLVYLQKFHALQRSFEIVYVGDYLFRIDAKGQGIMLQIKILSDTSPHSTLKNSLQQQWKQYIVLKNKKCNGSLAQLQREYFSQGMQMKDAICLISQIVEAVRILHEDFQFMHRDLKLDNLLYKVSDDIIQRGNPQEISNSLTVKLIDFEFSKQFKDFNQRFQTFCGEQQTMAPEVLDRQQYNKSAEIYSLGVIFTQLLVGREFIRIPHDLQQNELLKIITQMVSIEPSERPKIREVQQIVRRIQRSFYPKKITLIPTNQSEESQIQTPDLNSNSKVNLVKEPQQRSVKRQIVLQLDSEDDTQDKQLQTTQLSIQQSQPILQQDQILHDQPQTDEKQSQPNDCLNEQFYQKGVDQKDLTFEKILTIQSSRQTYFSIPQENKVKVMEGRIRLKVVNLTLDVIQKSGQIDGMLPQKIQIKFTQDEQVQVIKFLLLYLMKLQQEQQYSSYPIDLRHEYEGTIQLCRLLIKSQGWIGYLKNFFRFRAGQIEYENFKDKLENLLFSMGRVYETLLCHRLQKEEIFKICFKTFVHCLGVFVYFKQLNAKNAHENWQHIFPILNISVDYDEMYLFYDHFEFKLDHQTISSEQMRDLKIAFDKFGENGIFKKDNWQKYQIQIGSTTN